MVNQPSKPKKARLKTSSYTPAASFLGLNSPALVPIAATSSVRPQQTLPTNKLKFVSGGGFKVASSSRLSNINTSYTAPKKTVLQLLSEWNGIAIANGWEQEYVDSFISREQPPPTSDPDQGKTNKGNGVRPIFRIAKLALLTSCGKDTAMHEWTKEIDTFLKQFIILEGRGANPPECCGRCRVDESPRKPALYRCLTCFSQGIVCQECMTCSHAGNPLHRVQKWNGTYFENCTLKSLGLRMQLGHPAGETCPSPARTQSDDFVILDLDAVHCVAVDFCECGKSGSNRATQLLEHRLYPATVKQPKTAATFRLLKHFEILQYESKITPFEVFSTISRLTDNTGLATPPDRYPSLLRMVHEFRHLKLLKRSGRGHDPDRPASQTEAGECALLCPPCPHPGINMKDGWETEPDLTMYLHALNIGLDANFRLKRKSVSNDEADPGLSHGFSYFVEDRRFRGYIASKNNETEPKSTCSRHDAVNLADIRPGQGYAASGVATVECTRHNMKRPCAVGDLQRGERYSNMDYLLEESVKGSVLKMFMISYDIACQWSRNLLERIRTFSPKSTLLSAKLRFMVPKFHLPAHVPSCHDRFAFMLTPGAALSDGEAPERGWGESNPLATSTREMGPGTRRDTLDFNFGDYNWRKLINLGHYLLKRMDTALGAVADHVIAHAELESSPEWNYKIPAWLEKVLAWERDPTAPNPYEFVVKTPTRAAVQKELSEEEDAAHKAGNEFCLSPDISPSALIVCGLDLEAEQRIVKRLNNQIWDHSQDRQLSRTQFRTNTLVRKIDTWYKMLQIYIPATALLRQKNLTGALTLSAFELPLYLPSQIGTPQEALGSLRRTLQLRATLYDCKDRWARGQGANTRALKAIATAQGRIKASTDEYRQARTAILILAPILGHNVTNMYPPLEDRDIRSMTEAEPRNGPVGKAIAQKGRGLQGQGHTTTFILSWIWRVAGSAEAMSDDYAEDTARVEWAKSRARAMRYQEEILLVKEEMARTLRFYEFKEREWHARGAVWDSHHVELAYAEGLKAYAARQAELCRSFRLSFSFLWKNVDDLIAKAHSECSDHRLYYQRHGISDEDGGDLPEVVNN
ncbi:hypothetical protein NMY22_g9027 [Coprinellus aureogranulatus]|nr:hypothetical protein NMY22_g9027 [Coprinellus aureogranulatus]